MKDRSVHITFQLLIIFVWQLYVLFSSGLSLAAPEQLSHNQNDLKVMSIEKVSDVAEQNADMPSGLFVEEILEEEELHPAPNFSIIAHVIMEECPTYYILNPYYLVLPTHLVPPEYIVS